MSIFKESLPNYIKDQLSVREAAIKMGGDDNNENGRFSTGLAATTKGQVTLEKGAFYTNTINKSCGIRMASLVDLQSDDILDKDGVGGRIEKDFGGPGMALTYILEGGTIIKGVKDNKMTVNDAGDAVRSLKINEKPVMRRGFPTQKWNLGGTYGDPIIRADAKDGYGIVPMPGIVGVDVKTKSAYGSLREAKVKFECHNLRQLEILELLYMRPGFPVLLEWGWSVFVNNSGKIQKAPSYISENPDFWNAAKVSQEAISGNIIKKRRDSGGNYDGLLGFCKNFSYTARPDGGFTCSTELMAVGECMNSIKGNMVTTTTRKKEKYDMPKIQHLLNSFVDGIIGLAGGDSVTSSGIKNYEDPALQENYIDQLSKTIGGTTGDPSGAKSTFEGDSTDDLKSLKEAFNLAESIKEVKALSGGASSDDSISTNFVVEKMRELGYYQQTSGESQNLTKNKGADGVITTVLLSKYEEDYNRVWNAWHHVAKETREGNQNYASNEERDSVNNWMKVRNSHWDEAIAGVAKDIESNTTKKVINSDEYKDILKPGIHLIGPKHDSTNKDRFQGKMGFIRLDSFCKLLNRMVIPANTKPQVNQNGRIMAFQTNHLSTHGGAAAKPYFDTYKFNAYNEKFFDLFAHHVDLDISVDPFICLFPHQIVSMDEDSFSDEIEFYRPVKDVSGYKMKDTCSDQEFWGDRFPHTTDDINHDVREKAKRSVGNIYLNLDMLHKQCKKLQSGTKNEHFSLGQFMFNVLEEVNKATGGNHKLALINNHEFPNVINIVDINGETADSEYERVHLINVQSTESVVRKFSFNTEIPSAMSATIAVAAQNPNDANALDEVTFAALNRGIRNRLYRPAGPNTEKYSKKEKEKKKEILDDQIEELGHKLASIKYYNRAIKNRIQQKDDDQRSERTNNYRSTLIRVQSLTDILSQKDDNGLPMYLEDKRHGPPSSTPIPIKVDLEFDGIGGMVIGQIFRLNSSRLPKHYRNQNIVFLVKSEQQKIGKNGDWTTKMSGQMQLFETKPKRSKYGDLMKKYLDKAIRAEEKKQKEKDLNNIDNTDRTIDPNDSKDALEHKKNYEFLERSRKWYVLWAAYFIRAYRYPGGTRGHDWNTIEIFTKAGDHTMLNKTEINAVWNWMVEDNGWCLTHGGEEKTYSYYASNNQGTLYDEFDEQIGSADITCAYRAFAANANWKARGKRRSVYGHEKVPNSLYGPNVPGSGYKPIEKHKTEYKPKTVKEILDEEFGTGSSKTMNKKTSLAGTYEPHPVASHLSWNDKDYMPSSIGDSVNRFYGYNGYNNPKTFGGECYTCRGYGNSAC